MAFRTSASHPSLDAHYRTAKQLAARVRADAVSMQSRIGGNVARRTLHDYCQDLAAWRVLLAAAAAQTGIAQYARDEEQDQTYAIGTEYTALESALDAVVSYIVTNANMTERAIDASGNLSDQVYTPAQLSSLGALLTTLIGTIAAPA